jgi:hypothetical protein
VEGENGYFRRNHLVPVPQVGNLEELNALLLQGAIEDERRLISGRPQSIGEAMQLEREHLLPLTREGFDLAGVHFPGVDASACAKVLTNFYSVPAPVGSQVQAKVYAAYVEFWQEGRCIARHERCFGRQQKVLDLEHYLEVLSKKPGAFAGSTALEQWRAQGRWTVSHDRYWEALKQRQGKQEGTRAMIELLLLGRDYGYPALQRSLVQALACGCSDVSAVRLLLKGQSALPPRAAEVIEIGALQRYERPQPTLRNYDQLLGERTAQVLQ